MFVQYRELSYVFSHQSNNLKFQPMKIFRRRNNCIQNETQNLYFLIWLFHLSVGKIPHDSPFTCIVLMHRLLWITN